MGYPIYHSAYTAAQIEAAIGKGPRVNVSGYWEVWNVANMAYESTGVGAGVTPPTVVTQVSQMTNHAYVYIYNGTETGYTPGYWYYWDGSAWTAGGAYQVAATDPTLSVAGAAADAKATGDAVGDLKSAIGDLLVAPYGVSIGSLVSMGMLNPETGTNAANNSKYTRTGYVEVSRLALLVMDSAEYEFTVWSYTAASVATAVQSLTNKGYTTADTIILPPGGGNKIRIGIHRLDDAVLTTDTSDPTSDFSKIGNAIKFYALNAYMTVNGDNYTRFVGSNEIAANYPYSYFIVLGSAVSAGYTNAAFSLTHTMVTLGTTTQVAFRVSGVDAKCVAVRTLSGSTWTPWLYFYNTDAVDALAKMKGYDLYPTGDETDRAADIATNCTAGKTLDLAPGDYYFDTMVIAGHLNGAGANQTRLIFKDFNSSGLSYALRLREQGVLSNLTIEKYHADGDITPVEDYSLGQNGVIVIGVGSDDNQRIACTVENVIIKNFEGCGLFVRNTGLSPASGSCFHNVRVERCSAGIYLGEYAEFCVCSDCWTNFCYTGAVVLGGNNTLTGCDFSVCEICLAMPDSDGYGQSANDAHGIVIGCKMVHSGYYTTFNEGYAIKIGAQSSTEIIEGCVIANGTVLVENRGAGLAFHGCDFKKKTPVTVDNCAINIMSSIINTTDSPATVLNGGVIRRRNCMTVQGADLQDVTS